MSSAVAMTSNETPMALRRASIVVSHNAQLAPTNSSAVRRDIRGQPGTILGKALEPLPSGRGEILVLLSLQ